MGGRFTQETNMKIADNANIAKVLTISEAIIAWKLKSETDSKKAQEHSWLSDRYQ